MEKNLVLKLKGSIINNTAERLGYIHGTFCSYIKNITPSVVLVRMQLKHSNDIITFRKLSGDITFYKGSSFENLTEIKEDTVELTSNMSDKSLYIKGTTDIFYMKPSLGSRIEIGPASNILSFGTIASDWTPVYQFIINKNNNQPFNLLVESSNLLECEYLTKINLGLIINITDISDITELKMDNLQSKIIIPEDKVELNKLINENALHGQSLGEIIFVKIDNENVWTNNNNTKLKVKLTGKNFNTDIITYKNNAEVSYSGTEEDYPFKFNKQKIRNIEFNGDNTNFDNFFKALTKYNTIKSIDVNNVIITDASNSAIEQLKTKVTGIFKINNVDKKV